jgi:alkanesulfonate monooxygenase SsuD/methylene tetrahydromethanopterin reductase-like flavin-dependent oxidoreductase (luciferase family)
MSAMRVSLVLPIGGPSLADVVSTARFAEEIGLDGVWTYENLYAAGAFAIAGAAVAATSRIRVGVGTVSPFTRSPAIVAMEAGLLREMSGGRFVLGLGASPAELVGRLGIDPSKPLTVMREVITILRQLSGRGVSSFEGERFRLRDVALSLPVSAPPTPIYLGAIGDRMLGLVGQLGDGLILSVLCPLPFIARARQRVADAAVAAGRDPAALDVVAYVPFALRADGRQARDTLKPGIAENVARFSGKPDLEALLTRDGPLDVEKMAWIAKRMAEGADPRAVIDDALVDALAIAGDEQDARRQVEAYGRAGVKEIALFGVGTDEGARRSVRRFREILG